jgi:hypothetical protein
VHSLDNFSLKKFYYGDPDFDHRPAPYLVSPQVKHPH